MVCKVHMANQKCVKNGATQNVGNLWWVPYVKDEGLACIKIVQYHSAHREHEEGNNNNDNDYD